MYHKKASLSLSINAIVVLILAIVMLGLGMAFIKGMFGKVSQSFEQKVAEENEPSRPTANEPITLSREHIITNSDQTEILKVAMFNPTNATWTNAKPIVTCSSGPTVTETANTKTINVNSIQDYSVNLKIVGSPATYLCLLNISTTAGDASAYRKDLTIEIRS